MGPSPAARRFAFRLRLALDIRRTLRRIDAADVLTVVVLALLSAGLYLVFGIGWALLVIGGLLSLLTPVGTALRIFVRGR